MSELLIARQYFFTNFTLIALQIETKLQLSQLSVEVNFLTVEQSKLGRKWPPSGFSTCAHVPEHGI